MCRASEYAMETICSPTKARSGEVTGDMDGRAVWHRIGRAIDELQRTAPGHGEGVH